jgi:hypothetical protein
VSLKALRLGQLQTLSLQYFTQLLQGLMPLTRFLLLNGKNLKESWKKITVSGLGMFWGWATLEPKLLQFHHLDNNIDKKFTIRMNSPTILMGFQRVPKFGSSAHSGFVGSHLIICQLVLGGFFPCLIAGGFPFFQLFMQVLKVARPCGCWAAVFLIQLVDLVSSLLFRCIFCTQ